MRSRIYSRTANHSNFSYHRNRPYEAQIAPDYLERLNGLYEEWISSFNRCPVLTVPADDLDYATNPRHQDLIGLKVQEKLTGKDEVVFDPEEVMC